MRINPKKKFVAFIALIVVGLSTGYLMMSEGFTFTPELFKNYVHAMGWLGPLTYIGLFTFRPLIFVSSIALFVAGGLAFGPVLGPVYATIGATMGGALAFCIARQMGHDFVARRIKLVDKILKSTTFSYPVVLFLSILPVMPLTGICYGAGLSYMTFRSFILAHGLGLIPRAFVFGFFGSTLMDIGSPKFRVASATLLFMILAVVYFRSRAKTKLADG